MAKKIFSSILFILLFSLIAPNANALISTDKPDVPTSSTASNLRRESKNIRDQEKNQISQTKNAAKAAIQAKRDEFKANLQKIKDQRKKLLVENIDAKIAEMNKKTTDRFSEVLMRLQTILDNVSSKITDAKILADVKVAQTAIDTAKTAVDLQAAKAYTAQITNETALKINVGTTVSQFRLDLVAVYKLVVDAKQAVQNLNADRVLMKKEATNSGKIKTNL